LQATLDRGARSFYMHCILLLRYPALIWLSGKIKVSAICCFIG
jgi:hypothetical protein